MNNSTFEHPKQSSSLSMRVINHHNFVERFGEQVFKLKECELIKIKRDDIYVLLYFEKIIDLFYKDEFEITIIPLTSFSHLRN